MAKEIKITAGIIFGFAVLVAALITYLALQHNPQEVYTSEPLNLLVLDSISFAVLLIGPALTATALFFARWLWITKGPSAWMGAGIGMLSIVMFSVFWLVFV